MYVHFSLSYSDGQACFGKRDVIPQLTNHSLVVFEMKSDDLVLFAQSTVSPI